LPIAASPILPPMHCAIFFRINGGALRVVTGSDGQPREFADRDEAFRYTENDVAARDRRYRLADRRARRALV
jgi:hypothetical protein